MLHHICQTCGVQFAATPALPSSCPICLDERQYVGHQGQRWTTMEELRKDHRNEMAVLEPGLTAITTTPKFAIGQRMILVQSDAGNLLWDCVSLVDEASVAAILALGGVVGIAISHPHFYDSMVAWSQALGDVPIYLHAADRAHVMRPDQAIIHWGDETLELLPALTLIRCGGHFAGSTVLHWADGADGKGVLLTADTIQVVADRRWVTFMRSYPNQIPLPATAIRGIVNSIAPFQFDRIYGGWEPSVVAQDAAGVVTRSATRYIRAIQDDSAAPR